MALKRWRDVVDPREDLREMRPLDASEFAVHLDMVREKSGLKVYWEPAEFFARTYVTRHLLSTAAEVVRRLSGIRTETNAIFNFATQFGGGKTHAMTLLYHLAIQGPEADRLPGVTRILEAAQVKSAPRARVAVFVGQKFDSIMGRGGDDGTPLRRTPWGEIAWQLGGAEGFKHVQKHDEEFIAPGGDVLIKMLPEDEPTLILMDEVMNYISHIRPRGWTSQFFSFVQNLSEAARERSNVVLAVSIPASEMEMTPEDISDYNRFDKLVNRLGKAVIMSSEGETQEIIRRRLFDWNGLPSEGKKTCAAFADMIGDLKSQVPSWFGADNAKEAFEAAYPFHPSVFSVFERKWQALPRFQRTRGVLRMLALWVARSYSEVNKTGSRDPLIGLGSAPLEDPMFRTAVCEELGEQKLEVPITTDIAGKKDAHAVRLDVEAVDSIRKVRLHRKVATAIFFESNGGQSKAEATAPEIRLAVCEPDLDVGNIETVLEALTDACYYLMPEGTKYRFSLKENLNKRFADRRANIKDSAIQDRVLQEIQKVFDHKFSAGPDLDRRMFPSKSTDVPDRPVLTLVIVSPDRSLADEAVTLKWIDQLTRECGNSGRTFKSALVWCVPDTSEGMREEARKALAWQELDSESEDLLLDEKQRRQLAENLKRAERDLRESVWRTYKHLVLLGKENQLRTVDLGLVHSSAADSLVGLIMHRLRQDGDVEKDVSPQFLVRNWPPALPEWSTKAVRDAFFASPQFPRLVRGEALRETIAQGASRGLFAYVAKTVSGKYDPMFCGDPITASEVEISNDVLIVAREKIDEYRATQAAVLPDSPGGIGAIPGASGQQSAPPASVHLGADAVHGAGDRRPTMMPPVAAAGDDLFGSSAGVAEASPDRRVTWSGVVPPQRWTQFYTKALSKFSVEQGVRLKLTVSVDIEGDVAEHREQEFRAALRELGLGGAHGAQVIGLPDGVSLPQPRLAVPGMKAVNAGNPQVFPSEPRDVFVWSTVPYLVEMQSGLAPELYRDSSVLASMPELLLSLMDEESRAAISTLLKANDPIQFAQTDRVDFNRAIETLRESGTIEREGGVLQLGAGIGRFQRVVPIPEFLKTVLHSALGVVVALAAQKGAAAEAQLRASIDFAIA